MNTAYAINVCIVAVMAFVIGFGVIGPLLDNAASTLNAALVTTSDILP